MVPLVVVGVVGVVGMVPVLTEAGGGRRGEWEGVAGVVVDRLCWGSGTGGWW